MSSTQTKLLTITGWSSVALALFAIPAALTDPVVGAFTVYLALIVGGISSIGLHTTPKLAMMSLIICLGLWYAMTHYVASTGFSAPSITSILQSLLLLGVPLLIVIGLMAWGASRRAKANKQ